MTWTIVLLLGSNLFMTAAWYGHLKFKQSPLVVVILASWLIALPEYCLQVPANRIGYASGMSVFQLKIVQEVITLAVFAGFAAWYFQERIRWHHAAAFLCLLGAVFFAFYFREAK